MMKTKSKNFKKPAVIADINWGNFRAKFNGQEQKKFEELCYLLFCKEFQKNTGIDRYKNQAGIETHPITVKGKKTGFQAKFFDSKLSEHKKDFIQSIDITIQKQPEIHTIIFYINQDFSAGKNGSDPQYKTDIEEHAKSKGINITWKTASFFESPFVREENVTIVQSFFNLSKAVNISPDLIKSSQSESRYQELNRIRGLINQNQPTTALDLLKTFKEEKWEQLEEKEKYKVLTNMAWAKWLMKQGGQASELFIRALQFNPKDEDANTNCAVAYFTLGDVDNAKKYIEQAKKLNSLNIIAHIIEIQIKEREGCSLHDIISNLSPTIKENNKIAHIMSHISIKREQYTEAEKWLNIFYDQGYNQAGWKDTLVEADYADMYIQLILSKLDIASGRRAPDNLKDKLKKIIDIYKKLTTGEKYSELSRFYPEWHINYAMALELNGDLDTAIHVLERGRDYFPNKESFIIEMGRLFLEKKDIPKSIDILENEVGFNFLMKGNFANFMTQKYSSNKKDISKKDFFHLTMVLIDLYFQNKQNKKAWLLLEKIMQDPSVDEQSQTLAHQHWILRKTETVKQSKIITEDTKAQIEEAEQKLNTILKKTGDTVQNLILKAKIEKAKAKISLKDRDLLSQGQAFTQIIDEDTLDTQNSNREFSSFANIETNKNQTEDFQNHIKKHKQYLKEAIQVLKENQKTTKTNTNSQEKESFDLEIRHQLSDRKRLFQELYNSKMYQEAEPLLEEITNKNFNHPDIFHLLNIYFENGKNRQAIELAETLIKKFPHQLKPVNRLALIYESLENKEKIIQTYENFLHQNPQNQFIRIELALICIKNKQTHKAKKLLEKPFDTQNQMSVEEMNRLSWVYMKTGDIKKALETQYHCMKKYPREQEPQTIYFSLFQSLNYPELSDFEQEHPPRTKKDKNHSFLYPQKVALDCFILLKEIKTQEPLPVIIEKDSDYPQEHELSTKLFGKQVGDKILYVQKTYQIKEIKSKYLYKYQEIAENAEIQFGSKSFLKMAYVPKKPDIKAFSNALKKILPDRQQQQIFLDKLSQLYREKKIPIGFMAKQMGQHPIEIIYDIMSSQKDKFISSVPEWTQHHKINEIISNKTSILMDISSLMMVFQLKMEEVLEKSSFKLHVCHSTLDSLKNFGDQIATHTKDGLLQLGFNQKGEPVKIETRAEVIRKNLNFWLKIIKWTEKHCQIKTISSDFILSREERLKWEKHFGREFFDPILAVYGENNIILLSEDAILREFAKVIHQKIDKMQMDKAPSHFVGCGLLSLINYFAEQAILDTSQVVQFKAGLVKLNHSYIPLDHKILLFLLKEAEYSVNDFSFQRGLFFLGPVSDLPGVINVVANFLVDLGKDSGILPYRKYIIIHEVLNRAFLGRSESKRAIAYQIWLLVKTRTKLLPVLQNEIGLYIMEWAKAQIN